ncbi:hypothetical protein QYH69_07895 [Paraburkholderia sp. SARCC-3016]|uniref:hypothetical protein n=1 Tax=Paraburkholderia sp. SARCC-3016 TaxID=3058611 RepID=UPI002808E1FF|nr:hypothetical protein [Paraburkholderia sp. SARCC-3016]MDQ7977168.1 hypothetical protein [Paraburkholderia sp. SARCC-3016]
MPTNDTIKTSLRLPKPLHAELERVADAAGLTINAEMILRLQRDPRADHAEAIINEIRRRDEAIIDGLTRQIAVMRTALDRADDVLGRVAAAMSQVSAESEAAPLKRDVEYARELIGAVSTHR